MGKSYQVSSIPFSEMSKPKSETQGEALVTSQRYGRQGFSEQLELPLLQVIVETGSRLSTLCITIHGATGSSSFPLTDFGFVNVMGGGGG